MAQVKLHKKRKKWNHYQFVRAIGNYFRDVKVAKRAVKCKWVSNNPEKRCFRGKGEVAIACPTTCKNIMPCSCQDVKMPFKLGKKLVTCSEITQNQCDKVKGMKETCRMTCGECEEWFYKYNFSNDQSNLPWYF